MAGGLKVTPRFTFHQWCQRVFPDGDWPCLRTLRDRANRLNLGEKVGRKFYITEAEGECLLRYGRKAATISREDLCRPGKPPATSSTSALKEALRRSIELTPSSGHRISTDIIGTSRTAKSRSEDQHLPKLRLLTLTPEDGPTAS